VERDQAMHCWITQGSGGARSSHALLDHTRVGWSEIKPCTDGSHKGRVERDQAMHCWITQGSGGARSAMHCWITQGSGGARSSHALMDHTRVGWSEIKPCTDGSHKGRVERDQAMHCWITQGSGGARSSHALMDHTRVGWSEIKPCTDGSHKGRVFQAYCACCPSFPSIHAHGDCSFHDAA
jgi:CDGSH-type Zn-finger protein